MLMHSGERLRGRALGRYRLAGSSGVSGRVRRWVKSEGHAVGGVATDFQPSYALDAPGVTRFPHGSIGCSRCG